MKKLKRRLARIIGMIVVCLLIGTTAIAASEVEIAIEASQEATTEHHQRQVQTGDPVKMSYLFTALFSVSVGILCVRYRRKRLGAVIAILFLLSFATGTSAFAAEGTGNVNVTVPGSLSISFDEDGTNSIGEFAISNQSQVPITFDKVHVTECNGWSLADEGEHIPADTKKLSFIIEERQLQSDMNPINITVLEQSDRQLNISIERGAWTTSNAQETALQLEFEYVIGHREFVLHFDSNGSEEIIADRNVQNGDTVTLPSIEREEYVLVGWEDENGTLYTEQFVMPIGDTTLTARWKKTVAYALYIPEDTSLRFVRSAEPISAGDIYDGRIIAQVYTDFEDRMFTSEFEIPWYDQNHYKTTPVTKVVVEDVIHPRCTSHWFHWMYYCESIDVAKLDTSEVTDMSYMFGWTGYHSSSISITGVENFDTSQVTDMKYLFGYAGTYAGSFVIDVGDWDVSKVTNMKHLFAGIAMNGTFLDFGDIGKWNVSNVTDMHGMFQSTGVSANWYLDLHSWDVRNVTDCWNFDFEVDDKVIDPPWVD